MRTAIWWIRRDLRLADNQALQKTLSIADTIIPVYVLDPHLLQKEAPRRKDFLFSNLHFLAHNLNELGCPLVVRKGAPEIVLLRLLEESGATQIVAERDYSPYAIRRDRLIAENLSVTLTNGLTIYPPGAAVKKDGTPYTIFTPFSRAWKALPKPGMPNPSPDRLPPHPDFPSVKIPDAAPIPGFPAGEVNAHVRLRDFLANSLWAYHTTRDRMDMEGTSGLSPYFRFGILSANNAYAHLSSFLADHNDETTRFGAEIWLNELIWREFYINILAAFPFVLKTAFRENMRATPWRNDSHALEAWKSGLTGYPVVDAGMRQLAQTGWMHNRARMITASFLTKDLLINWQAGEAWFMRQLIDGDPASNNGGWQWTSGTGTDAAPYFRIFNPVTQSRKFDPVGNYIRTWVPELSTVSNQYIHEPWKMPHDIQSVSGVHIGVNYPEPIVDHPFARQRALSAYKKAG